MRILVNNMIFDVYFVPSGCDCLKDSIGVEHLGMTDLDDCVVCIRDDLPYELTQTVLQHELAHTYNCLNNMPLDEDERLAGFSGEFSDDIYLTSQEVLHYYGYS